MIATWFTHSRDDPQAPGWLCLRLAPFTLPPLVALLTRWVDRRGKGFRDRHLVYPLR